jgi:regulator of replication initiation timing
MNLNVLNFKKKITYFNDQYEHVFKLYSNDIGKSHTCNMHFSKLQKNQEHATSHLHTIK